MSPVPNAITPAPHARAESPFYNPQQSSHTNVLPIVGGAIGGLIALAIILYCSIFLWMKRMMRPEGENRNLRGWMSTLGTRSVVSSSEGSETVCSGGEKGAYDAFPAARDSISSGPMSTLTPPPSAGLSSTPASTPPATPCTPRSPRHLRFGFAQSIPAVAPYPSQPRVPVPPVLQAAAESAITPPPPAMVSLTPRPREPVILRPVSDRRVSWMTDGTNSTLPEEKWEKKQSDARAALRSYQREGMVAPSEV